MASQRPPDRDRNSRLGLIGLGNIGHAFASRLLERGFDLLITDLDRARAEDLIALGAEWGATASDVAAGADVVITCLPGPPETRAVMGGSNGVAAVLRAGSTWIETSTTDPHELVRISQGLAARGCTALEVPHSGGAAKAIQGKLTLYVGGERRVFENRLPILEELGETIVYLGPLGQALTAKLITNMMAFAHMESFAEALIMGHRAGLELRPLCEAINASFGASYVSRYSTPNVLADTYPNDFPLALIVKDCKLILRRARELGAPVPMGEFVSQRLAEAARRYGENEGDRALIRLLEDETGTNLTP